MIMRSDESARKIVAYLTSVGVVFICLREKERKKKAKNGDTAFVFDDHV